MLLKGNRTRIFRLAIVGTVAILAAALSIVFTNSDSSRVPIRTAALGAVTTPAISGPLDQTAKQVIAGLPTAAQVLATVEDDHVAVVVDGVAVSSVQTASLISSSEQAAATSAANGLVASSSGEPVSSSSVATAKSNLSTPSAQAGFMKSGVALAVFQQLLYNFAVSHGIAESTAAAQAKATATYNQWVAAGSPSIPIPGYMPVGTTVQDMMTSPQAVASLQFVDSVAAAESTIAGPAAVNQVPVNRQPALQQWFSSNLPSNQISVMISGSSMGDSQLFAALPFVP